MGKAQIVFDKMGGGVAEDFIYFFRSNGAYRQNPMDVSILKKYKYIRLLSSADLVAKGIDQTIINFSPLTSGVAFEIAEGETVYQTIQLSTTPLDMSALTYPNPSYVMISCDGSTTFKTFGILLSNDINS